MKIHRHLLLPSIVVFCQLYVSYANVVYFQKPENAVKTFAKVQVINEPDGSKDIELVKNINSIEKKDLGSGQIFSLGSFNQLSYDDVMAKLNKTIKEQERHFAGNKSWDYFLGALHSALYLYRVPHKGSRCNLPQHLPKNCKCKSEKAVPVTPDSLLGNYGKTHIPGMGGSQMGSGSPGGLQKGNGLTGSLQKGSGSSGGLQKGSGSSGGLQKGSGLSGSSPLSGSSTGNSITGEGSSGGSTMGSGLSGSPQKAGGSYGSKQKVGGSTGSPQKVGGLSGSPQKVGGPSGSPQKVGGSSGSPQKGSGLSGSQQKVGGSSGSPQIGGGLSGGSNMGSSSTGGSNIGSSSSEGPQTGVYPGVSTATSNPTGFSNSGNIAATTVPSLLLKEQKPNNKGQLLVGPNGLVFYLHPNGTISNIRKPKVTKSTNLGGNNDNKSTFTSSKPGQGNLINPDAKVNQDLSGVTAPEGKVKPGNGKVIIGGDGTVVVLNPSGKVTKITRPGAMLKPDTTLVNPSEHNNINSNADHDGSIDSSHQDVYIPELGNFGASTDKEISTEEPEKLVPDLFTNPSGLWTDSTSSSGENAGITQLPTDVTDGNISNDIGLVTLSSEERNTENVSGLGPFTHISHVTSSGSSSVSNSKEETNKLMTSWIAGPSGEVGSNTDKSLETGNQVIEPVEPYGTLLNNGYMVVCMKFLKHSDKARAALEEFLAQHSGEIEIN